MRAPGFYFRPPGLASLLLTPFGAIYGAVAAVRMQRKGVRADVPVICAGNPTLGGAGKTPTTLALAHLLRALGERPVLITRGYGGRSRGPLLVDAARHDALEVGDEALLLARMFPTVVARDRVEGAAFAAGHGASVIVLDDGFQNPALRKDASLLVVDGARGIGNGKVFPAGPLRAPLAAQLALAQAIVRVGEGAATQAVTDAAEARKIPVFAARLVPGAKTENLAGTPVLAFAGIGHPEKFFTTLSECGATIVEQKSFPDHHRYSAEEARALLAAAQAQKLALVTTEKDIARMQGEAALRELAAASRALAVRLQFDNEEGMRALLERTLAQARG